MELTEIVIFFNKLQLIVIKHMSHNTYYVNIALLKYISLFPPSYKFLLHFLFFIVFFNGTQIRLAKFKNNCIRKEYNFIVTSFTFKKCFIILIYWHKFFILNG